MYPQPNLLKNAPGITRDSYNKLYLHETEYGTDIIWYHPVRVRSNENCCSMELLDLRVLYCQGELFEPGNPPTEKQLETVGSTRSIICGTCGFHVWMYKSGIEVLGNSLGYARSMQRMREAERKAETAYELKLNQR